SRAAEPHRASRLAAVRHRARRFRAEADDRRGAVRRIRMVLPAALLASLDLAPAPGGLAGGARLSLDVVFVQAIEPDLALADSVAADRPRLAPADRAEPPPAPPLQAAARGGIEQRSGRPARGQRGRLKRVRRRLAGARTWCSPCFPGDL